MPITIPSPITGAAQTGFTSPTYTNVTDVAPGNNGKQVAVTALGGTQVGVNAHSVSNPFTLSVFRPAVLKTLPQANPITGVIKSIPNNTYKLITRKGVLPALNQSAIVVPIVTTIPIPAGADTYDAANIRAAISAHIGLLWALSASIGDTTVSGII
jgi:hypothetical protein